MSISPLADNLIPKVSAMCDTLIDQAHHLRRRLSLASAISHSPRSYHTVAGMLKVIERDVRRLRYEARCPLPMYDLALLAVEIQGSIGVVWNACVVLDARGRQNFIGGGGGGGLSEDVVEQFYVFTRLTRRLTRSCSVLEEELCPKGSGKRWVELE